MEHHLTVAKLRFPPSSEAFLTSMASIGAFFVDPDGGSTGAVPETGSCVSIAFVSVDGVAADVADMNVEFSLRGMESFYESETQAVAVVDRPTTAAMLETLVEPGSSRPIRFG